MHIILKHCSILLGVTGRTVRLIKLAIYLDQTLYIIGIRQNNDDDSDLMSEAVLVLLMADNIFTQSGDHVQVLNRYMTVT